MPYAKKIVLRSRWGYRPGLDTLVEDFKRDGVQFVAVIGKDCDIIEDIIDELYGDAGTMHSTMLTTSHVDGTLEEALLLVQSMNGRDAEDVQVIEF